MKLNQPEWDVFFGQFLEQDSRRHQGTTITDLERSVDRAEKASAAQGCYGSGEATLDDGEEIELADAKPAVQTAQMARIVGSAEESTFPAASATDFDESSSQERRCDATPDCGYDRDSVSVKAMAVMAGSATHRDSSIQDAVGVSGEGAHSGSPLLDECAPSNQQAQEAFNEATLTQINRIIAAQNSAVPPAIGAPAYLGVDAPGLDRGTVALILAQSSMLLSRSLPYLKLADMDCARSLAAKIRDHFGLITNYALAEGIGLELAHAQLELLGTLGADDPEPTAGDGGN